MHVLLLPVADRRHALHDARAVLPAHGVAQDLLRRLRLQGAQHLHLLVPHGVRLERDGRLHGDEAEELQHVVLHDVAEDAGFLVEPAAALVADRFGHRDLHVVDVLAVPDRLEEAVAEAEGDRCSGSPPCRGRGRCGRFAARGRRLASSCSARFGFPRSFPKGFRR